MDKKIERINALLNKYPAEQKYTFPILHDFQNTYGYISLESLEAIADYLGDSKAKIFADLTFNDAFTIEKQGKIVIQICDGTVCHTLNRSKIINELEGIFGIKVGEKTKDGMFSLKSVKCIGECANAPIIVYDNMPYGNLKDGELEKIIEVYQAKENPDNNKTVDEIIILQSKYKRVLLKSAYSINSYLDHGGYEGLKKATLYSKRKHIVDEIKKSGLRGRSGSGFPVGVKWESAYNAPGTESNRQDKYVIANGDEGDPGSFKDRWLMENNPHSVLEGLIIAGYAIDARKGYIFIRDEYPTAVNKMQKAIEETKKLGFIGKNILGTRFDFDCEIINAARSYMSGEESALIETIEGKRGIPRMKPPFPAVKGLFRQPTVINNVETLANVPIILRESGEKYAKLGIETCTGTKLISLSGKVKKRGIVEVPMGKITLRELVYDIGGGIEGEGQFKCLQIGGPLGGYITGKDLDLKIDFDSVKKSGSLLGSGAIIVMDDATCAVDLVKYFVTFLADESCGTCTPCREGLRCMLDILTRISEGTGEMEDLETLAELSVTAEHLSRCLLGRTIRNPVMIALNNYRDEFEEHIKKKVCFASVCRSLKVKKRGSENEN